MKGCVADGFPFVFGFTVYDSFDSAQVAEQVCCKCPSQEKAL